MGRLKYLRDTLPLNLLNNQQTPSVEFVLLDYSSPDGLRTWAAEVLQEHLCTGRVVFYSVTGYKHFHHAHAKNIAHRLARGKIVCNLDADNFTGFGFAEYLIHAFSTGKPIMLRSPTGIGGTFGRIALRKTDFESIGGYDERMAFGWGYEDWDLIKRAIMAGIEDRYIPVQSLFLTAILQDKVERTLFNEMKSIQCSHRRHKLLSWKSLSKHEFVANKGKPWGTATVTRNFSETIII
jgi:hypothetical protein